MILGISSYSFTWAVGVENHAPASPLTEIDLLYKANELGTKLLQIADNIPLHNFNNERIERLIHTAAQYNIEIEAGANEMTPENLERYLFLSESTKVILFEFTQNQPIVSPSFIHAILIY